MNNASRLSSLSVLFFICDIASAFGLILCLFSLPAILLELNDRVDASWRPHTTNQTLPPLLPCTLHTAESRRREEGRREERGRRDEQRGERKEIGRRGGERKRRWRREGGEEEEQEGEKREEKWRREERKEKRWCYFHERRVFQIKHSLLRINSTIHLWLHRLLTHIFKWLFFSDVGLGLPWMFLQVATIHYRGMIVRVISLFTFLPRYLDTAYRSQSQLQLTDVSLRAGRKRTIVPQKRYRSCCLTMKMIEKGHNSQIVWVLLTLRHHEFVTVNKQQRSIGGCSRLAPGYVVNTSSIFYY